ncbi:magnesium transporter [candidate division WWE3 bacterium]|uniref:Magnesium transporter n=1 Tax=candidate division WWE3 bacterium TaxID=2053526 RepID=A0A7X9DJT0_UNCKA|nr:magnesium transporter [candidate division WWE3 bacterium]
MPTPSDNKLYEVKELHTANDKNSAIKLVIQDFPLAKETDQIKDIETHLIENINNLKTINYIYIKNDQNQLTGILSIKELFRQDKEKYVSEVMEKDITSVKPTYSKERVTYVALRHSLKDIPVVDDNHVLLGVIPYDTIYNLAYKEARIELMKFAGLRHEGVATENIMEEPILRSVRHRIPWLFLGLLGGIAMAGIIDGFSSTLQQNIILAAFMPLIVYMSDAVGTQMEAFIIRDLAINPKLDFKAYFFRQLLALLSISLISSLVVFLLSFVLYKNILISSTLALSLTAAILSALITGLFIPKMFSHLKQDPANASGPIGTIIQDTLSVVIYLAVATLML